MAEEEGSSGGLEFILDLINNMQGPLAAAQAQIDEFKASAAASMGAANAAVEESSAGMEAAAVESSGWLNTIHQRTAALGEQFMAASEHSEKFQKSLNRAMRSAIEVFAGYEITKSFVEPAAELQTAMVELQAVTHGSNAEIQQAVDQADALSTKFNYTTESILHAEESLSGWAGGLSKAQALMPGVTSLARALGTSLDDAAKMIKSGLTSEGLPATAANVGHLSDAIVTLNHALGLSQGSAASFDRSLSRTIQAAKSYGIDINQAVAMAGEIQASGLGGARGGGMMLDEMSTALFKPDKHGANILEKYHVAIAHTKSGAIDLIGTLKNLAHAPKAVQQAIEGSSVALQTLALLLPELNQIDGVTKQIQHSTGATAHTAGAQMQTFDQAVGSLGQAWQHLRATIGTPMIDSLIPLVSDLADVIEHVNKFLEAHPRLTAFIADFITITGAVLIFVGVLGVLSPLILAVVTGFELLGAALAIVGITSVAALLPIIAILVAVGFAVYEVYTKWQVFVGLFHATGNLISAAWGDLWRHATQDWKSFASGFETVLHNYIEAPFTQIIHDLESLWADFLADIGKAGNVIHGVVHAIEHPLATITGGDHVTHAPMALPGGGRFGYAPQIHVHAPLHVTQTINGGAGNVAEQAESGLVAAHKTITQNLADAFDVYKHNSTRTSLAH